MTKLNRLSKRVERHGISISELKSSRDALEVQIKALEVALLQMAHR